MTESSMTTQVLADLSGVSAEVIRYYTKRGLLKPTRNRRNNYKLYRESDVVRLRFIRRAKNLGYTLNEIGKIFEQSKRGESPCPLAREILESRIADNRKKLDEMLELQTRIEAASALWATLPDKLPDGNTICYLIESTPEI
jgi:DNA-binding transcriptional MerR regulator